MEPQCFRGLNCTMLLNTNAQYIPILHTTFSVYIHSVFRLSIQQNPAHNFCGTYITRPRHTHAALAVSFCCRTCLSLLLRLSREATSEVIQNGRSSDSLPDHKHLPELFYTQWHLFVSKEATYSSRTVWDSHPIPY